MLDRRNVVSELGARRYYRRRPHSVIELFQAKLHRHTVKGKYGEPEHWDGLSTLFLILIERNRRMASPSERDWLRALRGNPSTATEI